MKDTANSHPKENGSRHIVHPVKDLVIKSGDKKLIEIVNKLPNDSLDRLQKILNRR